MAPKLSRQMFAILFAVFVLSLVPKIFSTIIENHHDYYLTDLSIEAWEESLGLLTTESDETHVVLEPALLLLGLLCLNLFSPSHHFTERYNLPPP